MKQRPGRSAATTDSAGNDDRPTNQDGKPTAQMAGKLVIRPPEMSWHGAALILGTVLFTVGGQLLLKWDISRTPAPTEVATGWLHEAFVFLHRPGVFGSLLCAALAFLCWAKTLSRFPLSYAYPFQSLSFVAVTLFSAIVFGETMTVTKVIGVSLIVLGVVVSAQ